MTRSVDSMDDSEADRNSDHLPSLPHGGSAILCMDTARLEEDVVFLKNDLADRDKQIQDLLKRLNENKQAGPSNNSIELEQQLAAMQAELEETRDLLKEARQDAPRLPRVKLDRDGDATVRCSAVSRSLPPVHPNFMAEGNFPPPNLASVPRPSTCGPPLVTSPRTPGE
eukprot:CAMPEP_0118952980 /NCGR_PEP_ID=MMETSP1169-20130426/55751_1 /TAXON_ID=36882 /ORGANISM="Pyramimonas obovata, Strain CCMP722" /LENGTH=168 /DNA_ID=CAMNT_0006900331 /DNA_START=164 /DNA_END=667 /DNA_ORIENTATION=-